MQSQPIPNTSTAVNSILSCGEMYLTQLYVIKFVSDLQYMLVFSEASVSFSTHTQNYFHDMPEIVLKVVSQTLYIYYVQFLFFAMSSNII